MKMSRWLLILFVPLFFLPLYFHENSGVLHLLIMALIWGVVAAAWDFMMGFAGIFTFGQIAFFVIGAYGTGMLTVNLGLPPVAGLILGGIIAGIAGILIGLPCLRLRGDYIALITFALHMILTPLIKLGRTIGTGGATGLLGIPPLGWGGYVIPATDRVSWYYAALGISLSLLFMIYKVIRSRFGLAFIALRDDEDVAQSLGVDQYKNKLMVFGLSAFITGIMGAFYAHYIGILSTRILGLDTFLLVMVMLVVGGMGRFPGALVGAFVVTFAAEFLRPLETYRYVIFGAAVVLSVLFIPQGIMGIIEPAKHFVSRTFKRRREEKASKT